MNRASLGCGCLAGASPLVVLLLVALLSGGALAGMVGLPSWNEGSSVARLSAAALPGGVGTPPGCKAAMCEVDPAGPYLAFAWVPGGGFPDPYQYGQCTYLAAYDFDPFPAGSGGGAPQNLGNGGDWYGTALRLGLRTLPPSALPPLGAAVSYRGFPGDGSAGHVAVVIADDPSGAGYWIYEMNVIRVNQGTGITDVRHMSFPGDWLVGSIPAPQASPAPHGG